VEIIFSKNKVDKFMTRFSQLGLNGVEAYYYNFTDEEKEFLLGQAKKHDLIISAGTDFHGKPGKPKTNVAFYELDDELVEDIVSKIKE
jgi:predicted metal-dependent phosphoesterase TrpH